MAIKYDLFVFHIDVDTAFLYGDLGKEIYVTQLKHFSNQEDPENILWLHKALYGLKQAHKTGMRN